MLSQCTRWPSLSLHLLPEIGLGRGCSPEMQRSLTLVLWQSISNLSAWPENHVCDPPSQTLTEPVLALVQQRSHSWCHYFPLVPDTDLEVGLWINPQAQEKNITSTPNKPTGINLTLPPLSGQNGHTQPQGMKVPGHKVMKSTQLHACRKRVLRNSSALCATLRVPVGFCISYQDHSIWSESVLEIEPLHKLEWDPPPTSSATEVLKTLLPTTSALIPRL